MWQLYQHNQVYNDSVANLANAAVFTGETRDFGPIGSPLSFKTFVAFGFSSHASAALGFVIEQSNDNVTWRVAAQVALVANTPATLSVPITTRYYRVKLTNGATLTTALMITSSALKL